jgi:diguanylate cyclase (GGDEF)-like protein
MEEMKDTLHNKIFKMLAGLVLITTLVVLAVVWNSTSKSITQNLNERLALGESVVVRELVNRQQTLMRNSHIIADDAALKSALLHQNEEYIDTAIETYRAIINAAFVSLRGIDGIEIKSTGRLYQALNTEQKASAITNSVENRDSYELIVLDKQLVWVFYLPINNDDGQTSAYAMLGFLVDEAYLQSLKELVALDISILVKSQSAFVISSLPAQKRGPAYLEESLLGSNGKAWLQLNPLYNKNSLFSRKFNQANIAGVNNVVYVSADGSEFKSQFLELQITIGAIALIALLIAIVAGRVIARQVTRQLEYIANYALNISNADYSKSFELDACSLEIEQLLTAFKSMEHAVKQRESEIKYQAQHDMLTKLYNRNFFTAHLNDLFSSNVRFQVIGINISGFRSINDVFGYHYGDVCVRELADRIKTQGGISARVTGGEILWIPPAPMRIEEIEQFKSNLDKGIQIDKISLPVTTSVGIINCPSDTQNAEELYRRMNIVIDEAQLNSSFIAEFSYAFEDRYLRRLSIIENLKNALANNSRDLSLVYQPKIDLETNTVHHAEALIRWQDDDLGMVPPDEFILIAEQAGLIHQVTFWVLEQVANDIHDFKKQGLEICVAVNISAQDLLDEDFTNHTRILLAKHGLCNTDISFELTESVIVKEPEKSIQQMQALRDEGFSLAIDDFGTGYSSLSYITQLPVDIIKIDKCFVMSLANSEGEQSICRAILKLASTFNMQVVAEGVEDMKSMVMLKKWGCKYAQGYHISRPIQAQELVRWVKFKQNITLPE